MPWGGGDSRDARDAGLLIGPGAGAVYWWRAAPRRRSPMNGTGAFDVAIAAR